MSAVATVEPSQASGANRAAWRRRERLEPALVFIVTAGLLIALGVRVTAHLHLVYPASLTRLAHAYVAWWNHPPRFRAIGFTYPPLQTVALLPFTLLRPLATSLVALPVFSGLCAGATMAILDRTLTVLGLSWWLRLPLLVAFALNPLFLDYGANGMATILAMALLAAGLHHFTSWYSGGADSVRSLGFCGAWLAIGFLARYEMALWLAIVAIAVAATRLHRGATVLEVLALLAILLAPMVYIFLIWSAVSSLVGGGGFLSWITRAGAQHIGGVNFHGRLTFGSRILEIVEIAWRISPMNFILPAALALVALVLRQPILVFVAATTLVGAAASILRMWLAPNADMFQPSYQMMALVPMLVASGWLIVQLPRPDRSGVKRAGRVVIGLLVLAGLGTSALTADALMKHDDSVYDRAFAYALASNLERAEPAAGPSSVVSPAAVDREIRSLTTFLNAAVYDRKVILVDELAFPGLILDADTTVPYVTRAGIGDAAWHRVLSDPRGYAKVEYLVVANPKVSVPGYPRDQVTERYPTAYSGHLADSQVIYRNRLVAVVQLVTPHSASTLSSFLGQSADLAQLFHKLPSLTHRLHR